MLSLVHLKVLAAVARHGSVTEAAKELNYSQPSVSHHLSRLEAATGAKLVQKVGRGIRLTPEGRLLANRATEIVGRVDAAAGELAAQVGLKAGRVRLAANASVLATIVPAAAAVLAEAHPGLTLSIIDRHPVEALQMLRQGDIDVALVPRHADAPLDDEGFRMVHVADDTVHLVSRRAGDSVANHRRSAWIGGCQWCQGELTAVCRAYGFAPRIESVCDDMVVVQALVAAGIGVTTLPGLSLRAHRLPGIHTTEIPDFTRRIDAVTFGEPPDPPATSALIDAITESVGSGSPAAR
jgi:DNA-binding transcriptional LysR family regulator